MTQPMRRRLERSEDQRLAPYALRSSDATRRHPIEDEGRDFDYRSQFQRDRDRIVYSRAFRRLRQKALAGILPDYEDHRRNRLTHTLEVSQIARTIGRALKLNEDLVEAVALSHDLGQPPFGPAGERALDDLLSGRLDGRGGPGLGDLGGFARARQGLYVVDRIEKRYEHPGLNLTDPVREGILKSGAGQPATGDAPDGVRTGLAPLFEVQVVVLADRFSTALSDLDDALQSGSLEVAQVERLQAVKQLRKKLGAHYPARAGRFIKGNAIHRGLTHLMVTGAVLASQRTLDRWTARHEVAAAADFGRVRDEAVRGTEVDLAPAGRRLLEQLERYLEGRVRRGHEADQVDGRGRRVLHGLFMAYHVDPTLLDDHLLIRYRETTGVRYLRDVPRGSLDAEIQARYRRDPRFSRLLADHLAAMTDPYAIVEHRRLMDSGAIPIASAERLMRET